MKSWWEERVFERDTRRLLAYYKHVTPNSIQDGDEYNARYLVWKYRGKKDKLWRSLQKKYGEPVLHEYNWPNDEPEENDELEIENLDDSASQDAGEETEL